jgi:hypothetical protein
MIFPVPLEELSGLRLLVVAIRRGSMREVFLTMGSAQIVGDELHVTTADGSTVAFSPIRPRAISVFDPAVLPSLVVPSHHEAVLPLARDVDACVALLTEGTPSGQTIVRDGFYGLAEHDDGRPLLMLADSSEDPEQP